MATEGHQIAAPNMSTNFFEIFGRSTTAIAISTLSEGVFVEVNNAFLDMHGYTRDEIIGHTSDELQLWQHPQARDKIIQSLQTIGQAQNFAHQYRHKSGQIGRAMVSVNLIQIDDQPHLIGFLTDISILEEAQWALLESNGEYRELFDNLLNGFAYCRMIFENAQPVDFIYLAVNKAFEQQTGLKNVVGKKVSEVIPGILDADTALLQIYGKVALTGTPTHFEMYVESLQSWYSVSVYCPKSSHFVAVFDVITERKRMIEELRNSKAQLKSALSSMSDAVFISDTQGRFVQFNDAFAFFHKFKNTEECARTLNEYPDFLEVFNSGGELLPLEQWAVPRSLRGEVANNAEFILRRKDTGERWIGSYSFSPIFDELGNITGSVVSARDITESKRIEIALAKSEREFRLLAESMPQIVWVTQTDGKNIYFNQQWVEYTGLSLEESYGDGWIKPFHPDDKQRAWNAWQNAVTANAIYSLECRLRRSDGQYLWWLIRGTPVLDNHGNIEKWFGTCTDINDIKISEQRLRIAAVAFDSHEGILITDADVKIQSVNHAFTLITGYSEQDVLGKNPNLLKSNRHDTDFYTQMWTSIREQGAWEGQIWNHRKNGEIYPEHLTITAVRDHGGDVVNYVGAFSDSTEREQTLDRLNAVARELIQANAQIEVERTQLADRVKERTAQLQYANRAKDSFLATMSHEIRTPLAGLLGMMELLELSPLTSKQSKLLNMARSSGNGLLRIVNDILDWSKIEAGKLELAPAVFNLASTLQEVVNTYAQLANDKAIQLQLEIDPMLGSSYRFDSLRLTQILNNFTSNALKFTEKGHIKLSAHWLAQHNGVDTIRFSVQDQGVGIGFEQQQRLFQQYEQASAATARMYGGTGLGLAICRRLAELMDGTLSVESELGVGSTFHFTINLPVVEVNTEKITTATDPAKSEQHTETEPPLLLDGRTLSILIVDDHPVNRMLLKQQLGMLGAQVKAAESGTPALAIWQNNKFDLIITDCHMPEMDGYELTKKIREIEQQAGGSIHIPIIAWTANVLSDEVVRCQLAGMDDFLTKPTELHDLKAMLVKWLNQQSEN